MPSPNLRADAKILAVLLLVEILICFTVEIVRMRIETLQHPLDRVLDQCLFSRLIEIVGLDQFDRFLVVRADTLSRCPLLRLHRSQQCGHRRHDIEKSQQPDHTANSGQNCHRTQEPVSASDHFHSLNLTFYACQLIGGQSILIKIDAVPKLPIGPKL